MGIPPTARFGDHARRDARWTRVFQGVTPSSRFNGVLPDCVEIPGNPAVLAGCRSGVFGHGVKRSRCGVSNPTRPDRGGSGCFPGNSGWSQPLATENVQLLREGHHRLPGARPRWWPGPAVLEGQLGRAPPPLRPRPGSLDRRSWHGVSGERAAGVASGCEADGLAMRGAGLTRTAAAGEEAVVPARLSVPRRDRRADPRAEAGLWVEALPLPRRAGDGSMGWVGDSDPQPVEDRGSVSD